MNSEQLKKSLDETKKFFASKVKTFPKVGIVLGSGWGAFAEQIENAVRIPYSEIPGFYAPTVHGHGGKLVIGKVAATDVVVMQGRVHHYEGHDMDKVVYPVRSLAWSGVKTMILTNAAGGLGDGMQAGDFMLIEDHVSFFCKNPLIGPNHDFLGTRFPDMTGCYDREISTTIETAFKEHKIRFSKGIYTYLTGPTYETKFEIQMLKKLGVHAVGMSTVPETVVLHHMGVKVAGISCISNLAAGLSPHKITHEEVSEIAKSVELKFSRLLTDVLQKLKV